jgi:ATP/maltotriose-dependent transcriptional regulator MalT
MNKVKGGKMESIEKKYKKNEKTVSKNHHSSSHLYASYMPRPRVDKVFSQMGDCKLVYVIGGGGCGKTQAVRHYTRHQSYNTLCWMQLAKGDNVSSRFLGTFYS